MRKPIAILTGWTLSAALISSGCEAPLSVYERLQHEDPAVRAKAVIEVAESSDDMAVPYLIDRLTDSSPAVRLYAIEALHRMTGGTFGYRHYDPPPQRREAVDRWRDWLMAGKRTEPWTPSPVPSVATRPSTRPATPAATRPSR